MNASAAMTRRVICISEKDSIADAWALMTEWCIRHLPVTEDGVLLGILSDRDVLRVLTVDGESEKLPPLPVSAVMTRNPYTCVAASTVSYVAGLMLDHKVDAVPVVDPVGMLVGLVTSTDLLELLRERDSGEHKVLPFQYELHNELRHRRASA